MSEDLYKQAIYKLFPSGTIMPTIQDDSNLDKVIGVIASALSKADLESSRITREMFPDIVGDFLDDWWTELDIENATGLTELTQQQKRNLILAWLTVSEYSNKTFFVEIAKTAGFQIYIENKIDNGSLLDWEFRVYSPFSTLTYFRAGESSAGDALSSTGNDALEKIIDFFKPAHSVVSYATIANEDLWTIDEDGTAQTINDNGAFATIQ